MSPSLQLKTCGLDKERVELSQGRCPSLKSGDQDLRDSGSDWTRACSGGLRKIRLGEKKWALNSIPDSTLFNKQDRIKEKFHIFIWFCKDIVPVVLNFCLTLWANVDFIGPCWSSETANKMETQMKRYLLARTDAPGRSSTFWGLDGHF